MAQLLFKGVENKVAVRALQAALNLFTQGASGLKVLKMDGLFGPRTESRLQDFQFSNDVTADGVFGPTTATAMSNQIRSARTPLLLKAGLAAFEAEELRRQLQAANGDLLFDGLLEQELALRVDPLGRV
jgi:peptidoglycan hydrolase-like protein with peptidoglycan-binding domain